MEPRCIGAVFFSLVLWGVGPAFAASQPEADFRTLVQKAVAREAGVTSVRCTWSGTKVIPKGSLVLPDASPEGFVRTGMPERDLTGPESGTIVMDGRKVFFDTQDGIYNAEMRDLSQYGMIGTFVDGRAMQLSSRGRGYVVPDSDVLTMIYFYPLMWAYRLFDPVLGRADPDRLALVGRAEHDGHPCIVVEQETHDGSLDRWWLSEDQDGCPLLWEYLYAEGKTGTSAAMTYEREGQGPWHLTSWRIEVLSRQGALEQSVTATVTEVRLNEPIDPSTFEMTFPPGTPVWNEFDRTEYVVGQNPEPQAAEPSVLSDKAMEGFVEKVEKETGARRPEPRATVLREPAEPAAAARPAAPPVPALAPPPRMPAWSWVLVGAGGLLLLIVAAITLSRRKPASGSR